MATKKNVAVQGTNAKRGRNRGQFAPRIGSPVYRINVDKDGAKSFKNLGTLEAVTRLANKTREYRLHDGTVMTDLTNCVFGHTGLVRAMNG